MTSTIDTELKKMNNQIDWLTICNINDIVKNTGVCADFNGKQVAVFHLPAANAGSNSQVRAVCNLDPFAKANVLSRGLLTEKNQQHYIASPLLKQEFCLETGQCQQDENISIPIYNARIVNGLVQLAEA